MTDRNPRTQPTAFESRIVAHLLTKPRKIVTAHEIAVNQFASQMTCARKRPGIMASITKAFWRLEDAGVIWYKPPPDRFCSPGAVLRLTEEEAKEMIDAVN